MKAKRHKQRADRTARHILVAVLGQTPQIVTETLYALVVQRRIPISEVFVITTRTGAERARRDLLDPERGQFFAFCREYGLDPARISFDAAHILTIRRLSSRRARQPSGARTTSAQAEVLEDIRTVEDNRCLAEQLLGFIKKLTEDPRTVLHGSIAGGRKTMSAYMALAFTLYGRERDQLYHVLVPERFEHNPQFFFPPRRSRLIGVGVGEVADTREARIELAEIPFVRLRSWLGKKKLYRTIEEQIRVVQCELDRQAEKWEPLVIDYQTKNARLSERLLPLTGVKLALFTYFAELRARHREHARFRHAPQTCPACFPSYSEIVPERYRQLCETFASPWAFPPKQAEKRWQLDPDRFLSYRSKINRLLERKGFPRELQITNIGAAPRSARYGLLLEPRRIRLQK